MLNGTGMALIHCVITGCRSPQAGTATSYFDLFSLICDVPQCAEYTQRDNVVDGRAHPKKAQQSSSVSKE